MEYLHQIPRINDGLMELIETDPVFSALGVNLNDFKWPYMGPGFPGLVRIVIGQQLSTAAAATIWKRFEAELPCVTPNAIMVLKDDEMRLLGMSHQKARYLRGLSEAVRGKAFDPMAMENLADEEVYAAITALNGFGNWSAEMYLMFSLARPDIWPAGDLGIQE